ncbi:gag-Pol polyprotein [Trichonephila clavipes]|nr:gag-Pol polyprotein [Trichonephila clavipes]
MPTTRAMEAQFQTLLEKLTEMKSELTASMNANMGELNTKLTNVNEQIRANKEELKSDLKGIGDKLTTMDKKFKEMEGRIESVEYKFENKFVDIENKFENKFEDMESKLEAKIFESSYSKPSIKLSTYDGKSSWQVYKTQFSIVADANQWDSQTKACQLAASLRADAADILQTLPETQRLDFDALVNALELRFGEKCVKDYSRLQLKSRQQKVSETLQELATDARGFLTWRFLTVRLNPASNTKGQTPHTSRQRIGHVELKCGAVRATDEKLLNRVESLMSQKADGRRPLNAGPAVEKGICREAAGHAKALKLIAPSQKGCRKTN